MPSTLINATATSNKIPHDPALPNMPTALDTNAMRDILQSRVVSPPQVGAGAEARYEIRDCAIVRVKYKAGRYCQVSYQLDMFDRVQQKEIRQILSARVYQRGVSQSRYQKAMKQNLAPTNLDEPVYHLPELDMVIWVFPNDRKLNKLAPFVDRNSVEKNVLPEIIHNRYGAGWELTDIRQSIMHYVPEHTCTLKVDVAVQKKDARKTDGKDRQAHFTVFGKTYYDAIEGAQSYNNMLQLWESDLRKDGRFNMAIPLGYHAATQSLWQLGLQGKTLIELPLGGSELQGRMAAAARCVAALHAMPVTVQNATNIQIVLNRLQQVRDLISSAWPTGKIAVNRIVGRLLSLSVHLPRTQPALLHGDLHLKNFFLSQDEVYLIDLDNLFHGPAAQDLGSFIAGLRYRSKVENLPEGHIDGVIDIFLQNYLDHNASSLSDFEIAWYTAVMLITERVYRCLTRLKAGRLDILHDLLALAEGMFDETRIDMKRANRKEIVDS